MEQWLQNLYANKAMFFRKNVSRWDYSSSPLIQSSSKVEEDLIDDSLVPIAINLEMDNQRYEEKIIWNKNDSQLSPEDFARITAEENRLSTLMEEEIAQTIRKQLFSARSQYKPQTSDSLKLIQLDLKCDNLHLRDHFFWDILDSENSPEDFAIALARDLGLNGRWANEIAFAIREQLEYYHKSNIESQQNQGAPSTNQVSSGLGNPGPYLQTPVPNFGFSSSLGFGAGYKKSTRNMAQMTSFPDKVVHPETDVILDKSLSVSESNCIRKVEKIYQDGTDNLKIWEPSLEYEEDDSNSKIKTRLRQKIK